ncbi:hypothetical protein [Aestuariivivens sediminis]|uniref:hypothetical protein n=1 Tax=Aestuariivivens sediminis TaxID=2913557 RepID=UPI001F55F81E|nr:hypothetical protein [Aestuariivivens sediminis]
MRSIFPIWMFYKPFLVWSLGINTFLTLIGFTILPVIVIKLISLLGLCYLIKETKLKGLLKPYKLLDRSAFKIGGVLFLIDMGISIPFVQLLGAFT